MKGAPDPLGLAVASYGEEARLHLTRAASFVTGPPIKLPKERWDAYCAETAMAVKLYAEQAAHGSESGVNSLRTVAGRLMGAPNLVKASIGDPTVQRLLVAYALTILRLGRFDFGNPNGRGF